MYAASPLVCLSFNIPNDFIIEYKASISSIEYFFRLYSILEASEEARLKRRVLTTMDINGNAVDDNVAETD